MSRPRPLPHVDPQAPQGPFQRAIMRLLATPMTTRLERSFLFRMTAWRIVPRLMRLTGGRLRAAFPFPLGVLETRDARDGRPHRRAVIYFHDGDRVTVIPSKGGMPEDPFWFQNALADPAVLLEGQPFRAEPVADQESLERLWALADQCYSPNAAYRAHAARSGRTIPILQLLPR